jgi:hypothetical protein
VSFGARTESIQTMKQTRQILVMRPGSRVDVYVTEWVREMMKVKCEEMNGKRISQGVGFVMSLPMGTC